ncbi:MAG: hypothetical protein E4H14_16690 [Candidatus Thorarchaeota archaeon]|nr:MAG: hypothetical protein E4H14_16690 [Candidatus Thorarchaeota archaeon]
MYHTTDSGDTWNQTTIGASDEPFSFYGVYFINRTHGWTSSNSHLYKTVDAGNTWEMIETWTFDDWAIMIKFATPQEGWAMGFMGIYHSTGGGETWEAIYSQGGWTLSFISDTEAWAVGENWLAKMSDGENWVAQPTPRDSPFPAPIAPYYSDIFFLDSQNGWLVGTETEIAYTPNGGCDWYSQSFPGDTRVKSIWFFNLTHGWAVGTGGYIYRTTTGNSLGSRLWMGLSDPIIIEAIGLPTGLFIILAVLLIRRKRKRRPSRAAASTVEVV